MITLLFTRTRNAIIAIKSKLFVCWYGSTKNVKIGNQVRFFKKPSIYVTEGSSLYIGDNVILNSDNFRYHLNMHSPCKILIDRSGAEVYIGSNSRIHGSCIHAYKKIVIGKNCLIAANCQIIDGNGHSLSFPDTANRVNTIGNSHAIIIEDNVWLGTNVVVLPGVTIGHGSVISANSVVHKDVPPMVVAGGNPLQIIKSFE
ncbi:Hexapeptide repeat of succinyl-transferase [Williamwhitmania taraxaci]|uniref:Hexapeptide repeat of succinyl-transferase n=2 Tax=Williamwhitmania taraxaci TaxID=1640674 RepID=A0A1G6GH62_9BACT|nr:acyltransferase [Williamwhitmania taraxaci]SDB81229.1 Hexapeptide repeat of succinyl-transferase [Williamwhitmania taraxaci]